ncbi:MAG: flippase-like domain-containing protein [Actinomycetota bacterium]|nr:flippase-like domain-containing protein [Actinomycetota bacterium]
MRPSATGAGRSETMETDSPSIRPSAHADSDPEPPERSPQPRRGWLVWVRRTVSLVLIVAGVVAAYGRRHDLRQAVDHIGNPAWGWLLCACVTQASSMIAFARLQRWLLRTGGIRVRLRDMVEITLAGNAMSTSLPGGAAWAAGWVWGQLRRRQVDRVLAGWVVLVAGALASFALFLLVVIGAFIAGSQGPVAPLRWIGVALLAVGALGAGAVVAVVRSERLGLGWRQRVAEASTRHRRTDAVVRGADRFSHQVRLVTPTPLAWFEALALALYNWVADLLTLVFVILTVHGHVPWRGVVVAYALTQIAASIPITPGGLAVVEASLAALLTAYGMPAADAITVVLLYRLISFWALVPIGWCSWGYLEAVARRQSRPDGQRRHHPWAEHRHVLRSPRQRRHAGLTLDARRGPEILGRPQACEDCAQNDGVGVSGAVGIPERF